jgi:hypothetical protein
VCGRGAFVYGFPGSLRAPLGCPGASCCVICFSFWSTFGIVVFLVPFRVQCALGVLVCVVCWLCVPFGALSFF